MSEETGQVTPEVVEPAATPENVATPTEVTEAPADVETQADDRKFTQAELNEIIQKEKAKAEAKAERRAYKAFAEKLEKLVPQQQPETTQPQSNKPQRANYADDEAWVEAVADWKLDQRTQEAKQQERQAYARTLYEKTEGFYAEAEKDPTFSRDEFDSLPLTQPIIEAVRESELAPKLMVHMAAHPEEVLRIAKLPPARQAAEIGKLEVRISTAPKVSKAPPPIEPIGGSKGSLSKNPAEMTDAEYSRWRKGK